MSYIEFDNVKKIYKMGDVKIKALNGASFSIDKGEFAVIAGASGAGKSTILNLMGGMDMATTGKIIVDKENVTSLMLKDLLPTDDTISDSCSSSIILYRTLQ